MSLHVCEASVVCTHTNGALKHALAVFQAVDPMFFPLGSALLTTLGLLDFSRKRVLILLFAVQLGASSTLSTDVSSVVRDDFDASVEANVTHLVTGWMSLMDSSVKGSAVLNASANASYEQYEV